MKISIMSFGQIKEIVSDQSIVAEEILDADTLRLYLIQRYPAIGLINYAFALNEELIFNNIPLKDGDTISILPPFSGG